MRSLQTRQTKLDKALVCQYRFVSRESREVQHALQAHATALSGTWAGVHPYRRSGDQTGRSICGLLGGTAVFGEEDLGTRIAAVRARGSTSVGDFASVADEFDTQPRESLPGSFTRIGASTSSRRPSPVV